MSGGCTLLKPEGRSTKSWFAAAGGEVRVGLEDLEGNAISGFSLAESVALTENSLAARVTWRVGKPLSLLENRPVRIVFSIKSAELYSVWSE